jgi:hypothetical protein
LPFISFTSDPAQVEILSDSPPACGSPVSIPDSLDVKSVMDHNILSPIKRLQQVFGEKFTIDQISLVYSLSNDSYSKSESCLLSGPTCESLLNLISVEHKDSTPVKLKIDEGDFWYDLISFYKSSKTDPKTCHLRIYLNNRPSIDTGGIRRQIYSSVYKDFAENKYVDLFDGPTNHLRPLYSAEARSSGLFTVLGIMVGHSLCQDGIGFPFLSPLCYYYMAINEEAAMGWISENDVGEDVNYVINKVLSLLCPL